MEGMAMTLADLLRAAIDREASDLHLIAGVPLILRVHGDIIVTDTDPLTPEQVEAIILQDVPAEKREVLERDLQLCHSITLPDVGYFRITIYYERGTLGASVRVGLTRIRDLQELGLPTAVNELARKPSGLILVTGPTGMGKTTTLNSMIDQINRERRCKIIMVEDPIEYVHSNKRSIVVQQEVHTDTRSFASALVHILRQDPDVIGVGEMRDLETIATALTAAETGHLVISTLHTPDAPQTIDRIIDVFPPGKQNQARMQLANSLLAVISQRLLPKVDRNGRVLATELMVANAAVRTMIRENKIPALYNVIETGSTLGMQSMDRCLKDLYHTGVITYDMALTHVRYPDQLRESTDDAAALTGNDAGRV
jgi:twitching motility protein PilT